MPSPKSPLDKPSSYHSKRPNLSRRSSGDKSPYQSTSTTSKHGVKGSQSAVVKTKGPMSDLPFGAQAPAGQNVSDRSQERDNGDSEQEKTGSADAVSSSVDDDGREFPTSGKGGKMKNSQAEEVERLRAAMNAQIQLNQHRERLAKSLGGMEARAASSTSFATAGGKVRVSPIHEEAISPSLDAAFASPLASGLGTASTESTRTVRGVNTPAAVSARTPSYPFPPMRTPGMLYGGHRPFTALSPTVNPANYAGGTFDGTPYDHVLSGSVTPASTLNFRPSGTQDSRGDPNSEGPNLYELSLMLSAEPGLDPWWTTVVQIMRDIYKAERVTLSIPADSTDIENVPWGQKATFNLIEEDELSLTYLPRGSSMVPSSVGTNETSNSEDNNAGDSPPMTMPMLSAGRPELHSRHSFTAYEDTKREPRSVQENSRMPGMRPAPLTRAKSYLSGRPEMPPRTGTLQNAQLNLQSLQDHMNYEDKEPSADWENVEASDRTVQGTVFPVLQALDYEAEPLIDSSGILRVLERGRVIALTRDYPYLDNPEDEKSGGSKSSQRSRKSKEPIAEKTKKPKPPELSSRISSFLGSKSSRHSSRSVRSQGEKGKSMPAPARSFEEEICTEAPKYEEYEQAPPSPWAQSPAPSPAVRVETSENPFFASAAVDEETFNPNAMPQDYSQMQQPETIGVDRSWTVLHIPLTHPLLSKPVQSFRLDAAAIESRSAGRRSSAFGPANHPETPKASSAEPGIEKRPPIAILSLLSPVIPYPSVLRHSLEHLAAHLATSFSLCRHYSNLENEIAGLSRKRPQTAGFGAVAPGPRPKGDRSNPMNPAYSPGDDSVAHRSMGGSMTSPSDYSGMSRSTAGSPGGTPGWDPSSVGLTMDKRSSGGSPAYSTGESYFSFRSRPVIGRTDTGTSSNITGARSNAKDFAPTDSKSPHLPRKPEDLFVDVESPDQREESRKTKLDKHDKQAVTSAPKQDRTRTERSSRDLYVETSENRDASPSHTQHETPVSPRRQALRTASHHGLGKAERQHTQLHSYGAEFGSTFQSLPTASTSATKSAANTKGHSRSGSLSVPTDMPPPSDRLKGLMLDSLPAHVFVALPQTGEIVWVNNRYLTYRGQTVPELYEDPWGSIHPEERDEYLKAWSYAIKTGEQFSMQVRIRRFDGTYRWFYTRAVGSRDIRGVIVQWYGSHMDIHDQHIAEVKAARQEEIEASEAKHRQLANLIPQIIFAATEDEGVTFANEQWLSYTGQDFTDALGLGFMDYVHPEDLAKCHIPIDRPPTPSRPKKPQEPSRNPSQNSSGGGSSTNATTASEAPTETTVKGVYLSLSRNNSSSTSSVYEVPTADLSELAKNGIIKVSTDSDGRLSYTTEVRLRSKTGEYRWHLVRCVEVDNINLGSGDGSWFGACTDINDHKLLETKLKEAMESKSKFLSNMSHEIRTPLIGISGMVNFLQDTVLNDEQTDYTNTISSSATSLLNIINDILDLSKVDAGMMKLSYEWFHIRSLVEEVNEMVSTLAITKRLELNYVVDVDVPEMVKGDKFRIRQVLLNVIGNAIKFTTVGEVFTRCRVLSNSKDIIGNEKAMIEFSVIDTGSGFTKEEADLIFKPFSQIDGSSTRQHGGSGLGLVISRQLVELHGGKMEGSAVPGKGSTFKFFAVFGLPTSEDYPEPPLTPAFKVPSARTSLVSSVSNEATARALRQARGTLMVANKMVQSPAVDSPRTESSVDSSAVVSSGSSVPSLRSNQTRTRSSSLSTTQSLGHFGEAARSSYDVSQMRLALPEKHSPFVSPSGNFSGNEWQSDSVTPTPASVLASKVSSSKLAVEPSALKQSRPPMYSILLICPQMHSREATKQHIENTLPKDVPYQITPLSTIAEAQEMIRGENPIIFTHIVLNLGSADEIVTLTEEIMLSPSLSDTAIVVLSDPVQRQEVIKLANAYDYEQLAKENRVRFIYKPVKPSRFAVIFDPDKERDLSTDRNRSSAQQQVATQKQNYLDVGKRLGNKGLKVLLVEDNLVNQKVLLKFLGKVGIAVELALDGVECTEKVFSHPHGFYSLILCDLHMPRKDGYQTCREIREWEKKESLSRMPIIALSANVMADVLDKCVQAGFNSYVTKPVDFKALSTAMSNLLDPLGDESL